jgi:hypothetical protein
VEPTGKKCFNTPSEARLRRTEVDGQADRVHGRQTMSDIFISYARDDRARIEILAKALAIQGWSVWWDHKIPFGKPFDQVIEKALENAKSIVVAWSSCSVTRNWVLEEASYARDKGILVPILLEEVALPIGFRRYQAADLSDWSGQQDHAEFRRLISHIKKFGSVETGGAERISPSAQRHTSIGMTSWLNQRIDELTKILGQAEHRDTIDDARDQLKNVKDAVFNGLRDFGFRQEANEFSQITALPSISGRQPRLLNEAGRCRQYLYKLQGNSTRT